MESKEFNVPRASAPSYEEAMKCSSVPPVRMYPTEEPPNYTPKPYPTQNPSQPIFQSLNTVDSTTISVEPASVANANTINIEQSQSAVQNRTKKSGSGYVVFLFLWLAFIAVRCYLKYKRVTRNQVRFNRYEG